MRLQYAPINTLKLVKVLLCSDNAMKREIVNLTKERWRRIALVLKATMPECVTVATRITNKQLQ